MASTNEFHEKVIKPFKTAVVAEISQAWFIRVTGSTGFLNAWSKILPDTESEKFQTYRNDSLRILYNYYRSNASNEFQGRFTISDRLLKCPCDALQLEYGGFKTLRQ